MTKLIIHGMRRSGTTVLFDAFLNDFRFLHLYEPLAAMEKPSIGGGSGVTRANLFKNVSELRRGFVQKHACEWQDLNFGAPRDPGLEFSEEFSQLVELYLKQLFGSADQIVGKFTRIYRKTAAIARLFPDAVVVLVVRDPRLVTGSYVFGKLEKRKALFESQGNFFDSQLANLPWSAGPLSELAAESLGLDYLTLSQVERIILLWKAVNEISIREGQKHFGERFILVKHEDFSSNPIREILRIYSALGLELPDRIVDWCTKIIRPPRQVFLENDPGWERALVRTGAKNLFDELGYG